MCVSCHCVQVSPTEDTEVPQEPPTAPEVLTESEPLEIESPSSTDHEVSEPVLSPPQTPQAPQPSTSVDIDELPEGPDHGSSISSIGTPEENYQTGRLATAEDADESLDDRIQRIIDTDDTRVIMGIDNSYSGQSFTELKLDKSITSEYKGGEYLIPFARDAISQPRFIGEEHLNIPGASVREVRLRGRGMEIRYLLGKVTKLSSYSRGNFYAVSHSMDYRQPLYAFVHSLVEVVGRKRSKEPFRPPRLIVSLFPPLEKSDRPICDCAVTCPLKADHNLFCLNLRAVQRGQASPETVLERTSKSESELLEFVKSSSEEFLDFYDEPHFGCNTFNLAKSCSLDQPDKYRADQGE